MSKIGEKSIPVESGTQVTLADAKVIVVGNGGTLEVALPKTITVEQADGSLFIKRVNDSKDNKALHGLIRSLIQNAVIGVSKAWEKKLEVVGTGFKVKMQGADLLFDIGYSHSVTFKKVDGITFIVDGTNKVTVSGIDKQLVGQVAHQIKTIRKPDPYKGKGIRYAGEVIKLKAGKKAKTAGGK
jgi:large subunit ribosomal protein L6